MTILLLTTVFTLHVQAQSNEFDQFFAAKLFLNPGLTSHSVVPEACINYRQTLSQASFASKAMQASFVYPIRKFDRILGCFGINTIYSSRGIQGVEKVSGAYINYAHNVRLRKNKSEIISVGLQGGMEFISVDFSSLQWGTIYSPFVTQGTPDSSTPESTFSDRGNNFVLNSGITYHFNPERNFHKNSWSTSLGISTWNLNRPNKSISEENAYVPPLFVKVHGSAEYSTGMIYVKPSMLIVYGNSTQYNVGSYLTIPVHLSSRYWQGNKGLELVSGIWYRYSDSFTFILGLESDRLGARFSYSLNQDIFFPESIQGAYVDPIIEFSIQHRFLKW